MVQKVKKITVILLALFLLCGCHGVLVPKKDNPNDDSNNQNGDDESKVEYPLFEVPEEFDTSREYNLQFWSKNDTNEKQKQAYLKAVEDFHKIYPNINITIRNYTNYEDIYRDVLKNIPTKSTPNICISYPDYTATYRTGNNVIVELTSLMNDPNYGLGGSKLKFDSPTKDEIIQEFFDEGLLPTTNGESLNYILPFVRSNEVLYLNKTYFETHNLDIPEQFTWDYLYEVARYARNYYDQNQKKPGELPKTFIPLIYKSKDNYLIQVAKQYDYGYTNESGEILYDNQGIRDFLTMINSYGFNGEGILDVFPFSDYPGNKINRGYSIMGIDSSAGATWIGCDAPLTEYGSIGKFEVLVTNLPQKDPNNPKIISQGPSICIFDKEDKQEVLASWLFSLYLLTNDVQIEYCKTEGYCPVTYKAYNSSEFQAYLNNPSPIYRPEGMSFDEFSERYYVKIEATKNVFKNIKNSFVTPAFKGSSVVRTTAGDLIQGVIDMKDFNEDKLTQLINRQKKLATM